MYPNTNYPVWRAKGVRNPYPVRYPVGLKHRNECLCSYKYLENDPMKETDFFHHLDYISSRKEIYVPLYTELVKEEHVFSQLQEMLRKGTNLIILEVYGPHQESVPYYMEKYGVGDDFITFGSVEINQKNIHILLNDPRHPFGHGYCLAMAILNKEKKWNN